MNKILKYTLLTPLLASLLTPLLLTSCSEDLTYENPQKDEGYSNVTFSGYGGGWSNGRPGTRAASADDVSKCTPANPMSIGVWGYYLAAGTYGAIGTAIHNDYYIYDQKHTPKKYEGNIPGVTPTEPYYKSLENYYFPYAPDAATHLDFVTQQYHYGVGADVLGEQDGGFPWENTQYMFYCYAPHAKDITESIVTARLLSETSTPTPYTGGDPSTGMNYIELSGLPSITNRDIAIGQQRRPWSRLSVTNYENSFGSCVDFHSDGYQLQHLYAAVQFCFALDEKYAEQRYLHIKDVTITTDEAFKTDDQLQVTTYTITKGIAPNDLTFTTVETAHTGTPRAIVIGEWTPTNQFLLGVKSEIGIIINDPGKLSATYQPGDAIPYVAGSEKYFAFGNLYLWPQDNKERTGTDGEGKPVYDPSDKPKQFKINVRYDVYDRTGQKTRENATANSIMTFPNTGTSPITSFVAGKYYNILIKIKPDFLYVLSDTDASADVIITGGK